jgi:outer membrane protein assembly factor BamB
MRSSVVYIGAPGGSVSALNASTGARLWSYATGSLTNSSPAVANGVVDAGSFDGDLYAFRLPGGLATSGRPSPGNLHPSYSLRTQRP